MARARAEARALDGAPLPKRRRAGLAHHVAQACSSKHAALLSPALTPQAARPYEVDASDHCETPFVAYRDVEPLLFQIAKRVQQQNARRRKRAKKEAKKGAAAQPPAVMQETDPDPKAALRIYDPFYCEGSVKHHLAALGFPTVHNELEDFYARLSADTLPPHDVLLTNPPFSGEHIPRTIAFATAQRKPFLLLLPNFCYKGNRFTRAVHETFEADGWSMSFLVPRTKYRFWAPGREPRGGAAGAVVGGADGTTNSPFECIWYVGLPVDWRDAIAAWYDKKFAASSGCVFARTPSGLPGHVVPVRSEKRRNPKARRRLKAKARAKGAAQ